MSRTTQHQRRMEQAANDHERVFAYKMMEMMAAPAFVIDFNCRLLIWNRACERLTGVPSSELIGTSNHRAIFFDEPRSCLADLLVQERTEELARLYPNLTHNGRDATGLSAEGWYDMPRLGRALYLATDASPVFDDAGKLSAVVQTMRDITHEKHTQIALEQMATRDGLSGLANRHCFNSTLLAEWARAMRDKHPLSLLMIDVDNFKRYNDTFGHQGGDSCLKRISSAIAGEMRANDLVARYGGEEFAVILPNQPMQGAAIVAERIRTRVEQLALLNGFPDGRFVTVSIGAATAYVADDITPSDLIATADAALYRAKHLGRNRICLPAPHIA
jgi:diguanylate cyclase (GGDEF)-like protein/PAS domain S-box-containing protein